MKRVGHSGISVVVVVFVACVLTVLGVIAWYLLQRPSNVKQPEQQTSSVAVCNNQSKFDLPAEATYITKISYPGQQRAGSYKTTSELFFNTSTNDVVVSLPVEGRLIGVRSYGDAASPQYALEFKNTCGLRLVFDQLAVLSLELTDEIKNLTLPANSFSELAPISGKDYAAGTIIATRIGQLKTNTSVFEFGVYDTSHKNTISEDKTWVADPQHQTDDAQQSVCWLDLIPADDRIRLLTLPTDPLVNPKTSDYCRL